MKDQNVSRARIEQTINTFWELYDAAKSAGNTDLADGFAAQAFELVGTLPENQVYLQTQH